MTVRDLTAADECALALDGARFAAKYGARKPRLDEELVFFCHVGHRSQVAGEVAAEAGYERVFNYTGSWVDWVSRSDW
jgi:3-mercaptopyruvate sulfurtransferase SseA